MKIRIQVNDKKARKKTNKFKSNTEANTFLPKILKQEKRRKLLRARRMSARKQNMGMQNDYLPDVDEI